MSKSRRNKGKHPADARKGAGKAPAGKQSSVAADETLESIEATPVDTPSGSAVSDDALSEQIFTQDEASAADAQMAQLLTGENVEAESGTPAVVEPIASEAIPSETVDESTQETLSDTPAESGAVESGVVESDRAVPAVETAAVETASEPAGEPEPSPRSGRRGKRHDKRHDKHHDKHDDKHDEETTALAPAPIVEMVVPAEPRTPAMEQLDEYQRLSLAHVAGTPQQSDAPGHWRGVGFRLGARRLAAAFDEVVEILSLPQITHVPGAQPWMLGVANVRGTLLPVVDLKQFLEGERTVIHEAQRILVVRQTGGNVAVLIDELFGQRSFNDAQMVTTDDEEGRYGYFVKQVYRVGDFDWGVFSMAMLTRTPEFRQAAA